VSLTVLDWRRAMHRLYAEVRAESDPASAHDRWRSGRHLLLAEHPASPLPPADRAATAGVPVAPYDAALRFDVTVDTTASAKSWAAATTSDGAVPFTRLGVVELAAGWSSTSTSRTTRPARTRPRGPARSRPPGTASPWRCPAASVSAERGRCARSVATADRRRPGWGIPPRRQQLRGEQSRRMTISGRSAGQRLELALAAVDLRRLAGYWAGYWAGYRGADYRPPRVASGVTPAPSAVGAALASRGTVGR